MHTTHGFYGGKRFLYIVWKKSKISIESKISITFQVLRIDGAQINMVGNFI